MAFVDVDLILYPVDYPDINEPDPPDRDDYLVTTGEGDPPPDLTESAIAFTGAFSVPENTESINSVTLHIDSLLPASAAGAGELYLTFPVGEDSISIVLNGDGLGVDGEDEIDLMDEALVPSEFVWTPSALNALTADIVLEWAMTSQSPNEYSPSYLYMAHVHVNYTIDEIEPTATAPMQQIFFS